MLFELHVIALNNEIEQVRERLSETASAHANLSVIVHSEGEFFAVDLGFLSNFWHI